MNRVVFICPCLICLACNMLTGFAKGRANVLKLIIIKKNFLQVFSRYDVMVGKPDKQLIFRSSLYAQTP